jgi:benzoyl-CoA reductase/2-hydroxyglutaryl-CoA dehydratase subunit BcrC/BadD/HgdB
MANAIYILIDVTEDPDRYRARCKRSHDGKVIGVFPMNFPAEIVAAAGALPVVVPDRKGSITVGNQLLTEFYCGYTRSLANQVGTGGLKLYDAFLNADHCIQLLGAIDVLRQERPEKPVFFEHLIAAMDDPWTHEQVPRKMASFLREVERVTERTINTEDLGRSIRSFNENRRLLRGIFQDRRTGDSRFTPREVQALVQSSMVMDRGEHSALLRRVLAERAEFRPRDERIRLHFSGHLCHAPRIEIFELFEECGATAVDDDLHTGARSISTDVDEEIPPLEALARRYFDQNREWPCPTRVQKSVHWGRRLLEAVETSGAEGVVVLMVRFCEPHMFHYPELRKALEASGVPHLLIETEHEGLPLEALRTRVEAFLERIRRGRRFTGAQEEAL